MVAEVLLIEYKELTIIIIGGGGEGHDHIFFNLNVYVHTFLGKIFQFSFLLFHLIYFF